ncbi:unnamed protein product, partial [Owenia fusiformis]
MDIMMDQLATTMLPEVFPDGLFQQVTIPQNAHNITNKTVGPCQHSIKTQKFIHFTLLPAAAIIAILMFCEQRKWKNDCCGGRPGLAIPLNLLDGFKHRWEYTLAFGATTNTLITILYGGDFFGKNYGPIDYILVTMVVMLEMSLTFYPLFACFATEAKFVGSFLGALYALMWFLVKMLHTMECPNPRPNVMPYMLVFVRWPELLCLFLLICCYIKRMIEAVKMEDVMPNKPDLIADTVVYPHQRMHVKLLLVKPEVKPELEPGFKAKLKSLYIPSPVFLFSTRMMSTVIVIASVIYQIGIVYVWVVGSLINGLQYFTDAIFEVIANSSKIDVENITEAVIFEQVYNTMRISWYAVTISIVLLTMLSLSHILLCYRENMMNLYQGTSRSHLLIEFTPTSSEIAANGIKYAGYQIAYMVWGFFLQHIILWLFIVIVAGLFIIPAIHKIYGPLQGLFQILIGPFILSTILYYGQILMVHFFFLQPKLEEEDEHKPLAVRNRKWYHIFSYYLFLFNLPLGLFSALVRIGKGILFGLLMLGRVDRCALMPDFETYDKGYMAYIGMIHMDYTHNHPVLRVFCQLLMDATLRRTSVEDDESECVGVRYTDAKTEAQLRSVRIRRRWQIA